jgi:hypothetical protein
MTSARPTDLLRVFEVTDHDLLFDDRDINLGRVDFLIKLGWKFRGTQ